MGTEEPKTEKKKRLCPYCDDEIGEASFPYCKACEVDVFYCPECRKPVSTDKKLCPECGAKIKG